MADTTNKFRVMGGFRILGGNRAGAGAEGSVYRAVCEDDSLGIVAKGTEVALKVMLVQDEDHYQWRKLKKRTQELVALNHPNVVRYYGCFAEQSEFNDIYVVVQEFLKGETLKERLVRSPCGLDVDEGLRIAKELVDGLISTTEAGIVHRDIKPANIFLCSDGHAKLIDFEIARQEGGTATTAAGNIRGSFDYMAPDFTDPNFHGDVRSDVFSMGVVLHEMLSGKTPYMRIEGADDKASFAFFSRWSHSLSGGQSPIHVSSRIRNLLANTGGVFTKALSPVREERYADFAQMRMGIDAIGFRCLRNGKDEYRLLQRIGKGGFGEVFKARLLRTGQVVAVKRLLKEEYARRFRLEKDIMKKLDSPCFVRFVDFFESDAGLFIVMDFLEGMPGWSLRDAISRRKLKPMSRQDVLLAFERYAYGLSLLHANRIYHRDIKPSNLYYPPGRPENAAIMDLGIARDETRTQTVGQVPGTLDYMPPEIVLTDSRGDSGMDIYALGLCLYESLTGKTAYPRLPKNPISQYEAQIERARRKVPPSFDDPTVANDKEILSLLRDMTNLDPRRRLNDAEVLAARINSIRLQHNPPTPPSPPPPRHKLAPTPGHEPYDDRDEPTITPSTNGAKPPPHGVKSPSSILSAIRIFAVVAIVAAIGCGAYFIWVKPQKPSPTPPPPSPLDGEMTIPDLATGVTCWFDGRQTNGVLRLRPDSYSCTYRKDWHFDQHVDFVVTAGRHGVIDGPSKWHAKPVPIRLPDGLDKSVSCLVDGRPFNKAQTVVVGKHTVVYVRKGYFDQTNKVAVVPAREKVLNLPDIWKPIPKPTPKPAPPPMDTKPTPPPTDTKPTPAPQQPLDGKMTIPDLATGVTCWFDGRQTNGVLRLRPGSYSCTYRKDWHFDQTVEFVVSAGRHGVVDGPAKWQAKPVPIRLPKLDKGVSYLIDGLPFKEGTTVDIGDHIVAYRRPDHLDQGVKFFVVPAKEKLLDPPGAWTPSEGLVKLNAAEERAKNATGIDELEAAKGLLDLANVSSPENIERRGTIKSDVERRLSELKRKSRETQRSSIRSEVAEAKKNEPIETRKTRLAAAEQRLRQAISEGLFALEEVQSDLDDIAKRKNWIVGKIVNNTGVEVKVGNQGIAAGAEEILKFENGLPANLVCAAAGYKDKPLREDFDGATIILSREDLVPEKVEMTIPQLEDGVICIYNDKSVSGKLMLEPGTYSCTYRKECYEDQTFGFEVQFGKPGTVKGPGTWVAKPVPVQSPQLDGEVTCLVDGRSFTAGLTLKVGEHECEYLKSDFKPQQRKFTVVPSSEVVLPKHGEWKPTEALKALKDAEDAVNAKEWSAAADYLKKADVVSKENRKKRDDLDRIVKSKIGVYNLIRSAIDFYDQTVYYDCVSNYYAAAQCGYELSADDVVRVESAYQKEIKEVNKYIKFYEDQIQQELDYNADLKDARERRSNLIKWHTYLVQK